MDKKMDNEKYVKENAKETSDLKVKKELLEVELVTSDKYVGSDWCILTRDT